MSSINGFVSFLRHYGPIPAGDNMYDELIQTEIERHNIAPAINIPPAKLKQVQENFEKSEPSNIVLTGTAGDGKTFHCRQVWTYFGGSAEQWEAGKKIASLKLPNSGKTLVIVKDLSELTQVEKNDILGQLVLTLNNKKSEDVFLIAANDGQLLATWRSWAESQSESEYKLFRLIEEMLIEERTNDESLNLNLFNLSRLDASTHFQEIIEQITEHPQWSLCNGCELLESDGSSTCPIRINRERLRAGEDESIFRKRLGELMQLARANRMHIPIRDLLLLSVNILLGDRHDRRVLLTCRSAKNRARKQEYRLTNPYANAFGANISDRQRQQYQIFNILEAYGIGRETDNKFDNLLIYGSYSKSPLYTSLIANDNFYGASAYEPFLRDYLEGERENVETFMQALSRQRQRLFFSLPNDSKLDAWRLTVYQSSGLFLKFVEGLKTSEDISSIKELLVRGLNRTFCGMMIEDGTELYLASSGGDGRGRIASLLNYEIPTVRRRRDPYLSFTLSSDGANPILELNDPTANGDGLIDFLTLQLTHFEYLVRVASGSLPTSFSRQCNEDFLDFKLRIIKRLDDLIGEALTGNEISLQALTVDEQGRAHPDNIRIRVAK